MGGCVECGDCGADLAFLSKLGCAPCFTIRQQVVVSSVATFTSHTTYHTIITMGCVFIRNVCGPQQQPTPANEVVLYCKQESPSAKSIDSLSRTSSPWAHNYCNHYSSFSHNQPTALCEAISPSAPSSRRGMHHINAPN